MTAIRLDPETLPVLDIVELANAGALRRAERETEPDGIPAFITAAGWFDLQHRYDTLNDAALVAAMERAARRLLTHAAATIAEHSGGEVTATLSCPSDLFEPDGKVHLAFIRDQEHPVICVVIGTSEHLKAILATH